MAVEMVKRGLSPVASGVTLAALALAAAAGPLFGQEERGWLGLEVVGKCEMREDSDGVIWSCSEPLMVNQLIAGSPAAKAGLNLGDTILAIDGVDITSKEGGRRFGALRAGEPVALRVRRDGRERTVTVTPGSLETVFSEWQRLTLQEPGSWDSVRVQLQSLSREQAKLQRALREAEQTLARIETVNPAGATERERRLADELRAKIDSIERQLIVAQSRLRLQADSLAIRTLYVTPETAEPKAVDELVAEREEEARREQGRITITAPYQNAVAGARFQPMTEGLSAYFPGSEGKGLLLVRLVEGTPAYEAGLREGDVVVSINGESVESVEQLREQLNQAGEAELLFIRKGKKEKCKISSN